MSVECNTFRINCLSIYPSEISDFLTADFSRFQCDFFRAIRISQFQFRPISATGCNHKYSGNMVGIVGEGDITQVDIKSTDTIITVIAERDTDLALLTGWQGDGISQ